MNSLTADPTALSSVVADAVAGDEAAFARLVGAYHLSLVRVAYVVCGDALMAEDAAQSAWCIAWRRLGSLRDPDRVRPWLVSVAANEARQLVRHERRGGVICVHVADPQDAFPSSRDDPSGEIDGLDLAAALRRLSPDDRSLVALRYAADLDATELGHALGMSPSGVRSRLSRLLARLRKDLGDD
jgi:RNA polymerase sigma factor (sigma-70 family)